MPPKEEKDQADNLSDVLGEGGHELRVDDGKLQVFVGPIRTKQFSGILKCLKEIGGLSFDWLEILTNGGDIAIRLIAEAICPEAKVTKRRQAVDDYVDRIGALNLLDAANIAGAWWEINKSFFVQNQEAFLKAFGIPAERLTEFQETARNLLEILKARGRAEMAKVKVEAEETANTPGPISSSSSSLTDTTSMTSANTP